MLIPMSEAGEIVFTRDVQLTKITNKDLFSAFILFTICVDVFQNDAFKMLCVLSLNIEAFKLVCFEMG